MDVFVCPVPNQATTNQVIKFFQKPFQECDIIDFHCEKVPARNFAIITCLDAPAAQRFLSEYGVPRTAPRHARARSSLVWSNQVVQCKQSKNEPSKFNLLSLQRQAAQRIAKPPPTVSKRVTGSETVRFDTVRLQCGVWDYVGSTLAFNAQFVDSRQGTITFGRKQAIVILLVDGRIKHRIDLDYASCSSIVIGEDNDPTVTFSLRYAPRIYSVPDPSLEDIFQNLGITCGLKPKIAKKMRAAGLDSHHKKIAGVAFVYRMTLASSRTLFNVHRLLKGQKNTENLLSLKTAVLYPPGSIESLVTSELRLEHELATTTRFGHHPFELRFQMKALSLSGKISPIKARALLPKVSELYEDYGLDATVSAIRQFGRQAPDAGPFIDADECTTTAFANLLENFASEYDRLAPNNPYELVKRYKHVILVHRIIVTPTGRYLYGPDAEPTNRVLRKYDDHPHYFTRTLFQDEDGGSVRYDPRASNEEIFRRFKSFLDESTIIAGRGFSFLGFSHSSLRGQSCWFMAPLIRDGQIVLPPQILKELGNFETIRVPAKCAARIGQNFTDTNATVELQPYQVGTLRMIQRNTRDFSDGVGTISKDLLHDVWKVYGTRSGLKPTVLQIRFQGAKGMVSLDPTLPGRRLMLRDNMIKFETSTAWNLEICGAAFRPLPMVLNRQFIKILEDLGVQIETFVDLQDVVVNRMRDRMGNSEDTATTASTNTASLLDEHHSTKGTCIQKLLQFLGSIGVDYRQDDFLFSVAEVVVLARLQEIKYRGRIPVDRGYTLYGIMDETGWLPEGRICVITEASPESGKEFLQKDKVIVTRSPALHPGDIQVVAAVAPPIDSPLRHLTNVVIFSQHGARDLPSQLSGGDLDGDLYNVVYDDRLLPRRLASPADYPRLKAVELDHPVTGKDMSNFFVEFLETDVLGMVSNLHVHLADQSDNGTFDPRCIKLASLASTAVDFSKTGIAVNTAELPKHDRCRPDFMAPGPRSMMNKTGEMDFEDREEKDDEAFEGLDAERKPMQYYDSPKALGHLFRAINERKILEDMDQQRKRLTSRKTKGGIIPVIWAYMKQRATDYGLEYKQHLDLARDIRSSLEDNLLNIMYNYEPSTGIPVSDVEVFAGVILGRSCGVQGRGLLELSNNMRDYFRPIVDYTTMRIIKGDQTMAVTNDLDELNDRYDEREFEAFPRALACLAVAVEEDSLSDSRVGLVRGFAYLAAAVCFQELQRYRITTFSAYGLPSI